MLLPQVRKTEVMHRVFLGLGSNLGDRISYLQSAVATLPDVVKISPLYETEPVGGPTNQPEYLNCVVELKTLLSPQELLAACQQLETGADRVRTVINGPRTLDIDVLLYDDQQINEPNLVIPHPRMWERRFVIQPLLDIAPDVIPDDMKSAGTGDMRMFRQYWAK